MTKIALRNFWFQFHKWIGLLLAIAIIPISLTGAALVWHDALEEALYPQRFAATAAPVLTPGAYVSAAKGAITADQRIAQLVYPEGGKGAVKLILANPPVEGERRPVRTTLWLDPVDGHVIDSARSDAGPVRFMHVLHGSLFIPEWGRPIVGWVGVAMLISSLSGLWLWWPTIGQWVRGLRWKRHNNFDTNLHHQLGFWIALPLFVLSATGVWISFPKVFSAFDTKPASTSKAAPGGGRQPPAQPLANPASAVDAVAASALGHQDITIGTITWPTEKSANWEIKGEGKAARTLSFADAGGAITVKPKEPDSRGKLASLMRKIHDGTDMGFAWQFIIFLGGILPAILSITGLIMWWRARTWRGELKARQRAKAAVG